MTLATQDRCSVCLKLLKNHSLNVFILCYSGVKLPCSFIHSGGWHLTLLCWYLDLCKNSIRPTVTLEGKLGDIIETQKEVILKPRKKLVLLIHHIWSLLVSTEERKCFSRPPTLSGAHMVLHLRGGLNEPSLHQLAQKCSHDKMVPC